MTMDTGDGQATSQTTSQSNGNFTGAVDKSADPQTPRLGSGNRIFTQPQSSMLVSTQQFKAEPEQRENKPDEKQKNKSKDEDENRDGQDKDAKDEDGTHDKDKKEGDDEKETPKEPPFYKRVVPMAILIGGVLLLVIVCTLYWLHARQYESTDDAFLQAHVTPISPKVAALVQDVKVDDNNFVHEGQVLVELDPRDFQSALNQAKANEGSMRGQLAQAQSNLEVSKAGVLEAQAELTVAQVNFENADRNYKRYQALDARATSKQQLDNVNAEERGNEAQVTQANAKVVQMQAQVDAAQSQIQIAQANVDRAAADRQQAELNLSYCTIVSPQDGYITRKSVEPGSYVSVGQVLFQTVPKNVWVIANFKETQLDEMRPGQPVEIHVDSYPGKTFHGKVDSLEAGTGAQFSLLPPENATGNYVKVVQRVPVKIVFDQGETDDPNHILGVGLSVEPEVKIK